MFSPVGFVQSVHRKCDNLRRGNELGHGLGALGSSMLGKLTREDEADGGLDLAAGEGGLFGVGGKHASLTRDLAKNVVDE